MQNVKTQRVARYKIQERGRSNNDSIGVMLGLMFEIEGRESGG
jgi:hypothetical protein